VLKSVAVKSYHRFEQLRYFVGKLRNNDTAVFLFHGVTDKANGEGVWVFSAEIFERFLIFLKSVKDVNVVNFRQFIDACSKESSNV